MPSQPSTARASGLPQETNTFTGTATVPENVFFTDTDRLRPPRRGHTSTLLPDGKVLIVGGYEEMEGPVSAAQLYDPDTGTFTTTSTLQHTRSSHTATLLPDGRVLIAGGGGPPEELYDPTTGTFAATDSLQYAHSGHTATLLVNGKVLIAGGGGNGTAELYDSVAGTFTPTGSVQQARSYHTATLLPNGKVLIAGGGYDWPLDELSAAELYDPAAGTFTPTGSLENARKYHTATLLQDGKVLIAGGYGHDGHVATAELYDPAAWTFTPTGSLEYSRIYHTATLLPSGKVLIAGGYCSIWQLAEELYDPSTGTFTATDSLGSLRYHTATLLSNGKVLIAGGNHGSSCHLPASEAKLATPVPSNVFTGTLSLPAGWVNTWTVSVSFSGTTTDPALDAASLSNDGIAWGSWITAANGETITTTWDLGWDAADKPVYLRLRDVNRQVATVVTGTVNVDTTMPSSSMTSLPPFSSSAISLSWSGSDNVSGIAGYDLQVREGPTGEWTPVLTGTTATSTLYYGTLWQAYYFRVRSTDVAGNVEAWPDTYDTATLVTEATTWNLYLPLILKTAP